MKERTWVLLSIVVILISEGLSTEQRQSIGGRLSIDKQSIVENDYKMKLLEILKTQDRKTLQEHSSVIFETGR